VLLNAAVLADVAGVLAGAPTAWAAGGRLLPVGLLAGVLVLFGRIYRRVLGYSNRGRLPSLFGSLSLLVLALWLRGHAEVQPDPPLLAAEILGAVWLGWITIRRFRFHA
jgi:hypothetical protein